MTKHITDIEVTNHGTLFSFHARTERGKTWLVQSCQSESYNWLGHATLCVEHRYAEAIALGAIADGLVVS